MLSEKMEALHKVHRPMHQVYMAIEAMEPVKRDVKEACEKLKAILDAGELVTIDDEIRLAVTTAYKVLEAANNGLNDPVVAGLFNPGKY